MSNEEKGLKDQKYNTTADELTGLGAIACLTPTPGLHFRSKAVFAVCSSCGTKGVTEVESGWSYANYLCCYYCGYYWDCLQLIRGKEFTLKNAVHKCSSCRAVIGQYNAC